MPDWSNVALSFCHPHEYSSLFGTMLWRILDTHPGIDVIDMGSGPMIAGARNEMAATFLDRPRKPEWNLMLDADMSAPPDIVDRLLAVANPTTAPLVGALCFVVGRAGKIEPTIKVNAGDGTLEALHDYPENSMVACEATGAACLLVHRSVFERLWETYAEHAYPFFADAVHNGAPIGEDVTFCARARQHGFPIHVHTGIEIGHVKPYVYSSYDHRQYLKRVAEIGEAAYQAEYLERQGLTTRTPTELPRSRRERRQLARQR